MQLRAIGIFRLGSNTIVGNKGKVYQPEEKKNQWKEGRQTVTAIYSAGHKSSNPQVHIHCIKLCVVGEQICRKAGNLIP